MCAVRTDGSISQTFLVWDSEIALLATCGAGTKSVQHFNDAVTLALALSIKRRNRQHDGMLAVPKAVESVLRMTTQPAGWAP